VHPLRLLALRDYGWRYTYRKEPNCWVRAKHLDEVLVRTTASLLVVEAFTLTVLEGCSVDADDPNVLMERLPEVKHYKASHQE
jgi:hypothetical protein